MLEQYLCSLFKHQPQTADTANSFRAKRTIDVEHSSSRPSLVEPSCAFLEMDLNKLIFLSTQQHTIPKPHLGTTLSSSHAQHSTTQEHKSTFSTVIRAAGSVKGEETRLEQQDSGIDLSVPPQRHSTSTDFASPVIGNQLSSSGSKNSKNTSSTTSSQLEHVLQRFQQSATMTLNGPSSSDWLSYSRNLAAVTAQNPNITDVAAALELAANSANINANSGNTSSAGGPSESTTLDLRIGNRAVSSSSATNKDSHLFTSLLSKPPFPIQQPPLLTPPDQDNCERSETLIEGENIACFSIGGEKRLCFPQIINIVLEGFTYQDIVDAIKELQIYSATCSTEQIEVLKRFNDIPVIAPSCGLITKTDAHRLCSTLLSSSCKVSNVDFSRLPVIAIYHECFGRTRGLYAPSLYDSENAACIQCEECPGLFTPSAFVSHSHRSRAENRTCHWGFDPANWRHYILPVEDCTYEDSSSLSSSSSALDFVPVCSGGRKAFKAKVKAAAASISLLDAANIEGAYHNKTILSVRKVLKEMKHKFAVDGPGPASNSKRAHSVGSTSAGAAIAAKRKMADVKESADVSAANRLYRSSSDGMHSAAVAAAASNASKRFKSASESSDAISALAALQQLGTSFPSILPFLNGSATSGPSAAVSASTTSAVSSSTPASNSQYSSHLLANLLSGSNGTTASPGSTSAAAAAAAAASTATDNLGASLFKSFLFNDPKTASTFNSLLKDPSALASILAQPGAGLSYPQLFFSAAEQLSNPSLASLLGQNYRSQLEIADRVKGMDFLEQSNGAVNASSASAAASHVNNMKSAATDFPMIYEHLTKAGEQKASIVSGTTASTASPFSSHAKSSSSAQSQHSLTVENLLNYSTKKSPMPKMDAFEVKPEVKYSNLALNGNASMSSIINESFIKKTLMDEEVKEQQPKRTSFSQPKEDYKSLIDDHVETLKHRMTDTKLHTIREQLFSIDKMCNDEISTLANRQTSTFKTKLFLTLFQMIDLLVLDGGLKETSSSSSAGLPLSPSRRLSTESKNSTEEEIVVDDDSNDSTPAPLNIKVEEERNCVEIGKGVDEISSEVKKEKASSVKSSSAASPGTMQSIDTSAVTVSSPTATPAAAMALSSSSSSSSSSVSSGASSPSPVSSSKTSLHKHKSHQEYLNAISTAINTLSKSSNGNSCSLRVTGEHSPLHHLGSVLAGVRENGSKGSDGAKVLLTTGSPL